MNESSCANHSVQPAAWLDRVEIVLCQTSMAENIGAAARAMKTMGLTRLVLVAPKAAIDAKARAVATHAGDVLDNARIVAEVDEAVAGSVAVWATTARVRSLPLALHAGREAAGMIRDQAAQATMAEGRVSILFGAERTGLTNVELAVTDRLLAIHANPDYPVLNLAQAVQLVAYELFHAALAPPPALGPDGGERPASKAELATLCRRLEQLLQGTSFFDGDDPQEQARRAERLLRRIRVMLNRAEPRREEVQILQGMISALGRVRSVDDKN